jgi:hypothetical protein
VSIEASNQLELKGSSVKVSGDSSVEVSGGTIKLN